MLRCRMRGRHWTDPPPTLVEPPRLLYKIAAAFPQHRRGL